MIDKGNFWNGSKICVKKYLKSPNWLRYKVKTKKYPFYRIDTYVNCAPRRNTCQCQSMIKHTRSLEYVRFKVRLKAEVMGFQTHVES